MASTFYLWFKVGHIVGFVAWFAGIFYIWRLFVYHAETESDAVRAQLAIMEYRLYKYIMRPAASITILFGLSLFYINSDLIYSVWIWVKLTLVTGVLIQHFLAEHYRNQLAEGRTFDSKFFRIMNEVPTLLLIGIVILAVLKDTFFSFLL